MRSIFYIVIGIILAFFGLSTFPAGVAQGAFGGSSTSSNLYSYVVADAAIGAAFLVLGVVLIAYGAYRRVRKTPAPSIPKRSTFGRPPRDEAKPADAIAADPAGVARPSGESVNRLGTESPLKFLEISC